MPTVNDAGDARQRQRGTEHRHDRDDEHQVRCQREVRREAEHPVVDEHEQHHEREADGHGREARLDVLLTEDAPTALLDDVHGRRERRRGAEARSDASRCERPVMRKRLPSGDWMVARLITLTS